MDRDGRDVLAAVVKASYLFDASGRLEQAPVDDALLVCLADQYHGDPGVTGLRYSTDVVPTKVGTDVAVVGHAYGRSRPTVEAGFQVGPLSKLLVVSGPRVWVGGNTVAGPVAFDRVPVRYEMAYGGTYQDAEKGPVPFAENPVGIGFVKTVADRAPLPHLEYPDSRLHSPTGKILPAALGFVPMSWKTRSRFAGTYDKAWQDRRRPLPPTDLDDRFYNAVPEDQVLKPRLAGGERLVLRNLHPEAERVVLTVPRLSFTVSLQVRNQSEDLPMVADTLLLEPDLGRLSIAYRASRVLNGDLMRVRSATFRARSVSAPAA
jgi:hypothetical protein